MTTKKGNINSIIDVQAIKSQIDYLQTSLVKITDQFAEIAVAIDNMNGKLKNAGSYKEINEAIKKNGENVEKATRLSKEYESVNKKQNTNNYKTDYSFDKILLTHNQKYFSAIITSKGNINQITKMEPRKIAEAIIISQ